MIDNCGLTVTNQSLSGFTIRIISFGIIPDTKAGWTYIGSTKTCNSKHHSHTTGGNVDHRDGFGNGSNNGSVNDSSTGNGGSNGSNDPSSNSSDVSSTI